MLGGEFSRVPMTVALALASFFPVSPARGQAAPLSAPPPGITFSPLTGANGAPYSGHTEGDFSVTATSGQWFEAHAYGNPVPSIFDGPTNAPGVAVLQITDNVDLFTLSSLQYSSNNGDSGYDIQGYLGAALVYDEAGALQGSFAPFSFKTLVTMNPSLTVDALLIRLVPGPGVTSINLDNINVATIAPVPEPNGLLLLGIVLARLLRGRSFGLFRPRV